MNTLVLIALVFVAGICAEALLVLAEHKLHPGWRFGSGKVFIMTAWVVVALVIYFVR